MPAAIFYIVTYEVPELVRGLSYASATTRVRIGPDTTFENLRTIVALPRGLKAEDIKITGVFIQED